MSRKILTFGYDACHRWAVLRLAGFTVHVCESIGELRELLMRPENVNAVIMVEDMVSVPQEAITAAKSYFAGPLILFQAQTQSKYKDVFDLCIPALSGPAVWLPQIDSLTRPKKRNQTTAILLSASQVETLRSPSQGAPPGRIC